MRRYEALRILREHADELRGQFGVKSLTLFGSVSRDEAELTSNVRVAGDHAGWETAEESRTDHPRRECLGRDGPGALLAGRGQARQQRGPLSAP